MSIGFKAAMSAWLEAWRLSGQNYLTKVSFMDRDTIDAIRRFNRTVTQRIGALRDDFLGRGRPLGQSRLLFEIGRDGAELRELRTRLSLDSGYASRLLRALEAEGLVAAGRAEADGRARRLTLTAKGLRELAELDRHSDAAAEAVLASLAPDRRARLVQAMAEVETLLQASAVAIAPEPADSAAALLCLDAYFRELAQRFETGFDPATSISATATEMTPPAGLLLLARLDGRAIGCAALKVKQDGIGEVKRMWVATEARGLGIGRKLLEAVEREARSFGLAMLRLETNRTLREAQTLYRSAGYAEVAPFNDESYAHHWFEKPVG
jgi:DNA-binding MarR family transcriptional regulator/ribosomal protein S18 acetylase RimI-like enzyme